MDKGNLIVFEGPDGAGKTTLAESLTKYLKVNELLSCELIAFPGNTTGTLGRLVYDIHHDSKKFGVEDIFPASLQILHIAAHIDAIKKSIYPKLFEGKTIILDRYWWSTWVYGVTSRVDDSALEAMINVELFYWGDYYPTHLFLIDRTYSLRKSVTSENWTALRNAYGDLYDKEKKKYPISIINNEDAPDNALKEIVGIIMDNI